MTVAQTFARSPELYPVQLDGDRGEARCLRLSEADYAAASFLDERLLLEGHAEIRAPLADLVAAADGLAAESDFIFHIGHVGSTLLARILGSGERVFALREPAILRGFALAPSDGADAMLVPLLRLYARVWRPEQRSLVKATSFVGEIAPRMLAASPSAKAILMMARPEVYIAGILAGDATRAELPRLTPGRLTRLAHRLPGASIRPPGSAGEMAAAGWVCEIGALAAAAAAFPDRVRWLDFDRFLLEPRATLATVLIHLYGQADPRALGAMLASPHMSRYAKAPEHPFSAGLRGQILRQSGQDNAGEIARGLRWVAAMMGAQPTVADAIGMATAPHP
jgi:hypothetical protein